MPSIAYCYTIWFHLISWPIDFKYMWSQVYLLIFGTCTFPVNAFVWILVFKLWKFIKRMKCCTVGCVQFLRKYIFVVALHFCCMWCFYSFLLTFWKYSWVWSEEQDTETLYCSVCFHTFVQIILMPHHSVWSFRVKWFTNVEWIYFM